MKLFDMNWMQVEDRLRRDDRAVVPLGSTEQHGYLSLGTDAILAERVALEAARPVGVPVFPAIPYGLAPYFTAYPGTVSLRPETYYGLVHDVLDSLADGGFRRILLVNGHGGNSPVSDVASEWAGERDGVQVRFHDWWRAPRTMARVRAVDPDASHASWMESFPWTRIDGVEVPGGRKPMVDVSDRSALSPAAFRARLGDGSFGGEYRKEDAVMEAIWAVAVEETRELLESGWEGSA